MLSMMRKFLSLCQIKSTDMSFKILHDKSVDYYMDRATELIAEYRTHREPQQLVNAARMLAYTYAKEAPKS